MRPSRRATKIGSVLLALGVVIILSGTTMRDRALALVVGVLVLILGQLFRVEGAIRAAGNDAADR